MNDDQWLKLLLDKLDNKVDSIDQRLEEMQEVHQKNSLSLIEHVERTNFLEEQVALMREQISPIEKHVDHVNFTFKLIGIVASCIGFIAGLIKTLSFLFLH